MDDHTFLIIWTLTACALAGLFALLHLIAAVTAMAKEYRPSHLVMLAGCVITAAAIPACLMGWPWNLDAMLMAVGGGTVCGAAYWNGKSAARAGDERLFHISHHIARFAFVLVLVMNFVRL